MAYDENYPVDSITVSELPQAIRQKGVNLNENINNLETEIKKHNIDGFNDFVKNAKLHGGVELIPYDDEKVEYETYYDINSVYSNSGKARAVQVDKEVIINFVGTGLYMNHFFPGTNRLYDVEVDGGGFSTITVDATEIKTFGLVELASDLAYGEHEVRIKTNQGDLLSIEYFKVIKSTDQTSQNDVGVSYIDSQREEIVEDNQSFTTPTSGRCDLTVVDDTGSISVFEGTDGAEEKAFRVEEDGTISREYVDDIPEWLTDVNVWNSGITGDGTTGWGEENNNSTSSQYIIKTNVTDESIHIGFQGTGLDVLVIEGPAQGQMAVSVDGGTETNYDNYNSSTQHQISKNVASGLDNGYHEIRIRCTGTITSGSDSIVSIDAFDIYTPATPSLPTDTQELAKAYPMPSPATMSSIPARPTSVEEKGWQRIESDDGCRYVGSGWNEYSNTNKSNKASYDSNTTDDYVEKSFFGDGIRLISRISASAGIAEISIDGTVETTVDLYSSSVINQVVAYENTSLSNGFHTIKVRVTGNKNSSSSGYYISIDAFEIHQPLRIEDTRTLSPITENSAYEIDYDSKLNKPLPPSVGGQLDRLEQMENVIEIENENGVAYLFPDGRAYVFITLEKNYDGSLIYDFGNETLPIILSEEPRISITPAITTTANYDDALCRFVVIDNLDTKSTLPIARVEINAADTNHEKIKTHFKLDSRWY